MQRVLGNQVVLCHSPKGCLSEAFTGVRVRDGRLWVRTIEDRNLAVHTDSERMSVTTFRDLRSMSRSSRICRVAVGASWRCCDRMCHVAATTNLGPRSIKYIVRLSRTFNTSRGQ